MKRWLLLVRRVGRGGGPGLRPRGLPHLHPRCQSHFETALASATSGTPLEWRRRCASDRVLLCEVVFADQKAAASTHAALTVATDAAYLAAPIPGGLPRY